MSITSAIVLFAVIWSVVFFIVLPFGQVSQHEAGDVVPGTPASAPSNARIGKKAILTTWIAIAVFIVIFAIVYFKWITIDDFPWLMPPVQY
ncbi:MAG: DUF1467 family protein [Pseudomonadota bacterium]